MRCIDLHPDFIYQLIMKCSLLMSLLDQTQLSPEQLAPLLGVGAMTVRRWKKAPQKDLPKVYERRVVEGIYQLIINGKLDAGSKDVQAILSDSTSLSFKAILTGLGVSEDLLNSNLTHEDKVMVALSQIGVNEKYRTQVEESSEKLSNFKRLGAEWQTRISTLWEVVRSRELTILDKFVAYGALFYLIMPFDLIPDHIPIIGLVDDFGILGFAFAYYANKYPQLLKSLKL